MTIDGQKPEWTTKGHEVGHRVEIPCHFDLWMRGARFGVVHSTSTNPNLRARYVRVKMDHPQVRRLVWAEANDVKFL